METVTEFIFLDSKITVDGDCNHEIKRHLLLGRKAMTNLDSILKSRDITLQTKVRLVKAIVFPVVMYGCESWTVKKVECGRIDGFELWCWRRLASPLDTKEMNILWKDWCWSWNFNTLATWYEELTHWKIHWCWERLKAGGEGDDRGWDGWMASLTQWTWVWVSLGSWWLTGKPGMLQFTGSQRVGHDWATELNWCHFLNLFLLIDSHFVKYLTKILFLSLFSSRQNKIKQFPPFQSLLSSTSILLIEIILVNRRYFWLSSLSSTTFVLILYFFSNFFVVDHYLFLFWYLFSLIYTS